MLRGAECWKEGLNHPALYFAFSSEISRLNWSGMERLVPGGASGFWLGRFSFAVVSSLPMELAWVLAVFSPGGRRSHDVTLSSGETCPAPINSSTVLDLVNIIQIPPYQKVDWPSCSIQSSKWGWIRDLGNLSDRALHPSSWRGLNFHHLTHFFRIFPVCLQIERIFTTALHFDIHFICLVSGNLESKTY